MKKIILFLVLILIGGVLGCMGQTYQPARPYLSPKGAPPKYYSTSSMKSFVLENNNKSKKYKKNLLELTGESSVESMFKKFRVVDDTLLQAGTYWNSVWNTDTQEWEPRLGKEYRGKVTVYESYKNSSYQKLFSYKNVCGNENGILLRKGNEDDSQGIEFSEETTTHKPSGIITTQSPIQSTFSDGRKPFTPAKVLPQINLGLPSGSKSPYSSASNINEHKFRIGWVVIPVAVIGAGIATYFIVKNNLKSSSSDDGSRITNGGHGDDGGPITPPGGP